MQKGHIHGGWAGVVMWWAGAGGGCHIHNWAEAVMQKPLAKLKYYRPTDGPMDL